MSEIIIKVDNFGKCYGDFKAVDGISFEVKSGEIFGIIGPNGAGKTTTLECLEGLRMIDSGTMEVLGLNPWKESRKIKNLIGVQLQSSSLPDTITVKESMELFSSYHKVKPRYDLLSRLGLGDKLKSQYHILSGGEKRRLAIALAVAHNPKVLILDEPTAALDVKARFELHKIIKELKDSGTTIILATHDMAEAEKMADRIAILLKGKIMVIGTPKEITAKGSALTKISVRTLGNSLEGFSKLIPTTYGMDAFKALSVHERGLFNPIYSIGILVLTGILSYLLSFYLFRLDNNNTSESKNKFIALIALSPLVLGTLFI